MLAGPRWPGIRRAGKLQFEGNRCEILIEAIRYGEAAEVRPGQLLSPMPLTGNDCKNLKSALVHDVMDISNVRRVREEMNGLKHGVCSPII